MLTNTCTQPAQETAINAILPAPLALAAALQHVLHALWDVTLLARNALFVTQIVPLVQDHPRPVLPAIQACISAEQYAIIVIAIARHALRQLQLVPAVSLGGLWSERLAIQPVIIRFILRFLMELHIVTLLAQANMFGGMAPAALLVPIQPDLIHLRRRHSQKIPSWSARIHVEQINTYIIILLV